MLLFWAREAELGKNVVLEKKLEALSAQFEEPLGCKECSGLHLNGRALAFFEPGGSLLAPVMSIRRWADASVSRFRKQAQLSEVLSNARLDPTIVANVTKKRAASARAANWSAAASEVCFLPRKGFWGAQEIPGFRKMGWLKKFGWDFGGNIGVECSP